MTAIVSQTRQLKIASQVQTASDRALIVSAIFNPHPRTAHNYAHCCSKSPKVDASTLAIHHYAVKSNQISLTKSPVLIESRRFSVLIFAYSFCRNATRNEIHDILELKV